MKINSNKKNKGFTLIELVIVLVILGMVIAIITGFPIQSAKFSGSHHEEYYFQSDMRDAMNRIDDRIKKADAVFAVQRKDFLGGGKAGAKKTPYEALDQDWSYIGVAEQGQNAGQVCLFEFNEKTSKWKETRLSTGNHKLIFSLVFDKKYKEGARQKMLEYELGGTPLDAEGNLDKKLKRYLRTSTEVLNAFTVVNRGNKKDPSVAIAFKSGDRKVNKKAYVTFVVDVSDSMRENIITSQKIDTSRYLHDKNSKMAIVHSNMKQMVETLQKSLNAEIAIVDFAQYATILTEGENNNFIKVEKNGDKILKKIDELTIERLEWKSWGIYNRPPSTNVGDGLRVAYHNIKKKIKSSPKGKSQRHYVVLLVDGNPTCRTVTRRGGGPDNYYYGDKIITGQNTNSSTPYIKGTGYERFDGFPYSAKKPGDSEFKQYWGFTALESAKYDFKPEDYNMSWGNWSISQTNGFNVFITPNVRICLTDKPKSYNAEYAAKVAKRFSKRGQEKLGDVKSFIITVGAYNNKYAQEIVKQISLGMGNAGGKSYKGTDEAQIKQAISEISSKVVSDSSFFDGPKSGGDGK